MRKVIFPLLLAAGLAGCAQSSAAPMQRADREARDAAKLAKALRGLTPGEHSDCVDSFRLRSASTQNYGDVLLYRVSSSLIYRNDTTGGCAPGLSRGDAIISRTPTGQLCRGDILETRDLRAGNMTTGSCTLGSFTQYSR